MVEKAFLLDVGLFIGSVLLIWLTRFWFLKTIDLSGKKYKRNAFFSILLILLSTIFVAACLFFVFLPEMNFSFLKFIGAV